MAPRLTIGALAALVAGCFSAIAQGAPSANRASGAWHIEPAADSDAKQDDASLRTPALDNSEASLSLRCKPEISLYEFVVRDPRLTRLPAAEEVSFAIRHPGREPARLLAVSRGNGSVVIQERIHQTAFALLLASLLQADGEAVEIAIDDQQWVFPLPGFAAALTSLTAQCGFPPDPQRGRARR
jgi:hypothetical protein